MAEGRALRGELRCAPERHEGQPAGPERAERHRPSPRVGGPPQGELDAGLAPVPFARGAQDGHQALSREQEPPGPGDEALRVVREVEA